MITVRRRCDAQHAAAADPRKEQVGAGFGQGLMRERWIAFLESC